MVLDKVVFIFNKHNMFECFEYIIFRPWNELLQTNKVQNA